MEYLIVFSLIGVLVGVATTVIQAVRRKPLKVPSIALFVCIVLLSIGLAFYENPQAPIYEKAIIISEEAADDYDAMVRVYDWVTHNIVYDAEKLQWLGENPQGYYLNSLETLENRQGICGDYAELTKDLLLALDILAEVKEGSVVSEQGKTELHAWVEATIEGVIYALDTTWGAGYLDDELSFVARPLRLYLTNPEEMALLHGDINYREQRHTEMLREISLSADPVYLDDFESELVQLINETRREKGKKVPVVHEELQEKARLEALRIINEELRGEEWELDVDSIQKSLADRSLFICWILTETLWLPVAPDEVYLEEEFQEILATSKCRYLGIGVVRRGEMVAAYMILAEDNV